jgi:hypothetical protein
VRNSSAEFGALLLHLPLHLLLKYRITWYSFLETRWLAQKTHGGD